MKLEALLPSSAERTFPILKSWTKSEGGALSPLALQDFGKFLMSRPEHREGSMTCHRLSLAEPLEIIFFADDLDSANNADADEAVYSIKQDYESDCFEITTLKEKTDKLSPMLREFGLSLSTAKSNH